MLGLRARTALTALLASGAALGAVLLLVGPGLRERATAQARERLLAEARLMARAVADPIARGAPGAELDALVDQAARDIAGRVTIVAPDGRVLADSSVSGPELARVENHAGRPEVREALAAGQGTAVRHSATIGQDLLYAAVAVRRDSDPGGPALAVARTALPLTEVAAQARSLRHAVAAALLVAFLIAAVLSTLLTSPMTRPLREMLEAAREFAAGNLGARIRVRRGDELGELGRILNGTAQQLEERLEENRRERARTEAILSAMDEGVLAVDHRGLVLLANEALRGGLGLGEVVGRHYLEAIRHGEVDAVIQDVLAFGERRERELEVPLLGRGYALTGVPLAGASGAPRGVVVTFHDITQRRRLDKVRRDFVANASHELRTPLTSIRGFVEALEDGALGEPATAERFLGKIRTHADRMAALVEDLLELSRLESGESPPRWARVRLGELAEDVVGSLAPRAERRGTRLAWRDLGAPTLVSDPERLRHVLENLLDNALKYTPPGGHVELTVAPTPEGGARLTVADDGPGIAAEHLPRLFERFYRVDAARSRELGGTGLGLAIVRHLAESVGGVVRVESEPGRGSRFSVLLPPRTASD